MLPFGHLITASEILPPDFFVIHDWQNPQKSAEAEWRTVWIIEGRWYAHPNVLKTLEKDTTP